jgi:hypothetical protein
MKWMHIHVHALTKKTIYIYLTPARDPKQILFVMWEKASGRRQLGEASGRRHLRRHLRGCIWKETSEERHLGRGICEDSGKTWDHLG